MTPKTASSVMDIVSRGLDGSFAEPASASMAFSITARNEGSIGGIELMWNCKEF